MIEIFNIVFVVVVTQLYIFVKTQNCRLKIDDFYYIKKADKW